MKNHSFRFGVVTIQNVSWKKLVERCKFIEKVGFDSFWIADHFAHWKKKLMPLFDPWTILTALACQTSRIRMGTFVSAMHYHHPAWLAKQALAVDHISNGRLELGLGAGGSSKVEYSMTGIEEWKPSEKVKRFHEYVEIVDQLLRNPVTSYCGQYYKLEDATMLPDPVQKPRPPILIGARGPLMLKIVARQADTWNILGGIDSLDETFKVVREKNSLLDKYCKQIGRDPQTIRRSFGIYEREAIGSMGAMKFYESPEILEEIVKRCYEIGFTEIILPYPFVEKDVPAFEHLAQDIVPELRKQVSTI